MAQSGTRGLVFFSKVVRTKKAPSGLFPFILILAEPEIPPILSSLWLRTIQRKRQESREDECSHHGKNHENTALGAVFVTTDDGIFGHPQQARELFDVQLAGHLLTAQVLKTQFQGINVQFH